MKFSRVGVIGAAIVAVGAVSFSASNSFAESANPATTKPTIVLVHDAFADASSWNGVIERLQAKGYPVVAPANPLRGLPNDSAYIESVLKTIKGPVVLVGHSYGGEVITNAASQDAEVKALVYVAGIAPVKGESMNMILGKFAGSELPESSNSLSVNAGGSSGIDLYVKPDKFRQALAADVPERTAAVMAASQRPINAIGLADKSEHAAWQKIPSWYLVAKNDQAIPPAAQRFMAKRAKAHITEVESSHVVPVSQPAKVANLIIEAAKSVVK
ncbi:alpha/beta fold hydrolase [Streptomyces sp. NPDC059985]|uniref:alpha/beta fold hydrolase n=1 Tax=Streptomyces sp. NPDC059985 TaxID=3347025 RepID=UPI00367817B3